MSKTAKTKAKHEPAIFLVYGTDDLAATRKADEIVNRLCPPENQALGLETIAPEPGPISAETAASLLRTAMQALLTPSFLGGAKTVYLRDAAIFNPLTEPGRFEAVKTQTAQLVEMLKAGLPDGVSLVVLTNQINKSTSFYKTFAASGEVHAFDAPEKPKEVQEDFIPAMEQLVKDRGLQMARPVLMALLDRTGYNRRLVENEIEKLAIYAGNRKTVTAADIQLMVAPVRESKFYEFASTFCDGDLDDTLQVLRRMFAQREEPIALLINLQNRLRDMIIMADCLKRGWAVLSGGERFRTLKWDLPPKVKLSCPPWKETRAKATPMPSRCKRCRPAAFRRAAGSAGSTPPWTHTPPSPAAKPKRRKSPWKRWSYARSANLPPPGGHKSRLNHANARFPASQPARVLAKCASWLPIYKLENNWTPPDAWS